MLQAQTTLLKVARKDHLRETVIGPGVLPPEEAAQKNASQRTIEEAQTACLKARE